MIEKIKEALFDLIAAIQAGKIYADNHPKNQELLDKAYSRLKEILNERKEFVLGIVDNELAWENEIMFDLSKKSRSLILFLQKRGIERIVFQQALRKEEIQKFIKILSETLIKKPENSQETFNLEGIQNIRAGKIKAKTQAQENEVQQPKPKGFEVIYKNSVKSASGSIHKVIKTEDIDYLDLRMNVLNVMENFMGRHQELLNLTSVKRKDLITFAHILNVSILSMFFASKNGFSKDDVLDIGIAALFHDVGKIAVSSQILKKEGKLTDEEFDKMRDHTVLGTEILLGYIPTFGILPAVVAFEHHMRFDQTGYPKVAFSRKPHLVSLIVSICDVYDALAQKRSYKSDFPPLKIYNIMLKDRGKFFEPQLFDAFYRNMGVWPIGCIVKLSDNRITVVREVNQQKIFSPKVEILDPKPTGEQIDLGINENKLKIIDSLNPLNEGKKYVDFI